MIDTADILMPGAKAPDFRAMAVGGPYGHDGKEVSLSDFGGKCVVLYFYPKDDTPGCTTQACALRDEWSDFEKHAAIFGVSIDDAASHRQFIQKYTLPFPLLSDPQKEMVQAYGVWVEKNMYGKTFMGTERSTFVIGPDGNLLEIFRKVSPARHTGLLREVLGIT